MRTRIGFVGLGIMGRGMAANLVKAGYELTVYNRTRAKAKELEALGARAANTPADAAANADIVFTMLADPPAVEQMVLGTAGVIEGLQPGAILIDCSTVDPETSACVREAAEAKNAQFLDAPVAGSKDAAIKGELILMVGGDSETLERAKPALDVISKKIIYAGPSGSGTMLKLCFNLVVSHMMAALSEALVLGTKAGLSPQTIIDTIMTGVIGSRFYEWKGSCILDRDFTTNFSLKLMHKDLSLIASAGYSLGTALPVTAAVKELYAAANGIGNPEEDFCAVVKALEQFAQVEVKRQ